MHARKAVFNSPTEKVLAMTTNLESKKSTEPRDRTQSNPASGDAIREITGRTKREGLDAGELVADAGVRTSGAAGDATRIAGEYGWEAMLRGVRAMTEIQAHAAGVNLDQGRRVLGIALRVADTYREATDRTADKVQALTDSCMNVGRGLQNWQQECLAQFRRSAEHLSAKQQDFSRRRSEELVKVQRDVYVGVIDSLLRANNVFFDAATKNAQDTATSLQEREAMDT
jgi:hypothetical protein